MFGGVTHISLDSKNRIAIPARYRDVLQAQYGDKVIITLESAQYLLIYPEQIWINTREKVQNLPNASHPLVKSYQRLVLGYAETVEVDKAGRILLPAALRSMVHLERDVALVGIGNRFELWDNIKWYEETHKALQVEQDDLAALLGGFSL